MTVVTKTREEWDEMTPAEKREHLILEEKNVFGYDVKHDRHGNPIEQGFGGPLQPTAQHVEAIRIYYKGPDKDEVIARETKRLHEYEAKKHEERRASRRRGEA
jgi:hypothetical protein